MNVLFSILQVLPKKLYICVLRNFNMSKKINISFPDSNVQAKAELLQNEAPETCRLLWQLLEHPIEGKAIHAMYSGREIWTPTPPPMTKIPPENLTCFPIPGDILYNHFDQATLGQNWENACANFSDELAFFYGRGGRCFNELGWVPGNRFATIVENLEEFAAMGSQIQLEGAQKMIVTRIEKLD